MKNLKKLAFLPVLALAIVLSVLMLTACPGTYATSRFTFSATTGVQSVTFSPDTPVEIGTDVTITITIADTHERGDNFAVTVVGTNVTNLITWNGRVGTVTRPMVGYGGVDYSQESRQYLANKVI